MASSTNSTMSNNTQDITDLDTLSSDDKYDRGLNVHNIYAQFSHNFPKSSYITLDSVSLVNNNVFTMLIHNIRSIPKNLQSFIDTVLGSLNLSCDVLGLTETRLEPHLAPLYQLPGYSLFTGCRNTYGGGVAMYISDKYHAFQLREFSLIETYLECVGIQLSIKNSKSILLCVYRPPSGSCDDFIATHSSP